MTHHFREYTAAVCRVEHGWTQKMMCDENGICPLEAIRRSIEGQPDELPWEFLTEIDQELRRSLYYRWFRFHGSIIEDALMHWNDAPWRRKSTVVKFLRRLAHKHEHAWLREENERVKRERQRQIFEQLESDLVDDHKLDPLPA